MMASLMDLGGLMNVVRAARLESLRTRIPDVTDRFELARLLVHELATLTDVGHGVLALVDDDGLLEVSATTRAIVPPYLLELLEDAFLAGERLTVAGGDDLDWGVPGRAALPLGTS